MAAELLQAAGASMNGQLYEAVPNPWIASVISFGLVFLLLVAVSAVPPRPLPTDAGLAAMPWHAPLGGVVGAVAVDGGLTFVTTVGTGLLNGLTSTADIATSVAIVAAGAGRGVDVRRRGAGGPL